MNKTLKTHASKQVLRAAIDVQNEGNLEKLKSYLPTKEHEFVDIVGCIISNTKDRVYDSPKWSMDYSEKLISQTEQAVLSL
jgi:hypothetical protein